MIDMFSLGSLTFFHFLQVIYYKILQIFYRTDMDLGKTLPDSQPLLQKILLKFFYRMDIEHYESLKKRKNRINSITEDYSFLS